MAIEPPCSVVCAVSKGEWEYAKAYSVHPSDYVTKNEVRKGDIRWREKLRTQMSTFSSSVQPVLTSKSSGAR